MAPGARNPALRASASASARVDLPQTGTSARRAFEGPLCHGRRVQFYGVLDASSSVVKVGAQIAYRLVRCVEGVAVLGRAGPPKDENLRKHAGRDPEAPISVYYGTPDGVPPQVFDHATTLGGFVCESDRIPDRWVRRCNRFDLIFVPSRFCRDVFRASGVETPIAIVRHGLEPEYQPVPLTDRGDRRCFYDVVTRQPHRKGCVELVRSFVRAFEGRNDVVLRLRASRTRDIERALAQRGAASLVELDESTDLPIAEFAAVYSSVHCVVHPARCEGFGLIPFQSIACEAPVIAPRATGMADYLDDGNAIILRTLEVDDAAEVYYGTGRYPRIDEDHLVDLLRHADQNWDAEKTRVAQRGAAFRTEHRWDRVLEPLTMLVSDLAALCSVAQRRERIRAFCLPDG